ncbi:phBC6A51 family helix-turn-helix protein [Aetokthonos hydrillicola Thurmond2011]|jgi:transcriptional regulator with XRE-family HTH domain|uniref:PhBC6A51 family helix-turn-helix protein n=1 Tax=Aetokthonos hydrillicola Thurmond2011 TaxID=2712845 RepID=A0AAP5IIG2_9CYAN|nr:phBC6A51 family helix-turn-helix protein [Aetokthonos hydrillicola]MBW4591142.1 hypothetical protein [Aetokthonos hydrillicola CCALA 1050]MDR9900988.1 phBC6A51 family helix-turn-helix protein [Aetokthonos hydrillicola Thurmond2011]
MALTPKQRKTAELMAKGYTQEKISKLASISYSSISEWNKNPEFIEYKESIQKGLDEAYIEFVLDQANTEYNLKRIALKEGQAIELLAETTYKLIEKYQQAISNVDAYDIKPSALSQGLKQLAETLQVVYNMQMNRLGVDRVITEIEAIKTLAGSHIDQIIKDSEDE